MVIFLSDRSCSRRLFFVAVDMEYRLWLAELKYSDSAAAVVVLDLYEEKLGRFRVRRH